MLDGDIAQTLGAILREELLVESEILCIDGVMLRDFDYIDLGRIRMPSYTVPVTIKSLVFSEDPQGGRPAQRIHHHDDHDHGTATRMITITAMIITIMATSHGSTASMHQPRRDGREATSHLSEGMSSDAVRVDERETAASRARPRRRGAWARSEG